MVQYYAENSTAHRSNDEKKQRERVNEAIAIKILVIMRQRGSIQRQKMFIKKLSETQKKED